MNYCKWCHAELDGRSAPLAYFAVMTTKLKVPPGGYCPMCAKQFGLVADGRLVIRITNPDAEPETEVKRMQQSVGEKFNWQDVRIAL